MKYVGSLTLFPFKHTSMLIKFTLCLKCVRGFFFRFKIGFTVEASLGVLVQQKTTSVREQIALISRRDISQRDQ